MYFLIIAPITFEYNLGSNIADMFGFLGLANAIISIAFIFWGIKIVPTFMSGNAEASKKLAIRFLTALIVWVVINNIF